MEMLAYLTQDGAQVSSAEERPDGTYAALVALASPKLARIKPLVADAVPGVTAVQLYEAGPYVIEAARVRKTWVVRNKTAAEVQTDNQLAELTALKAFVANLTTDIQAGVTVAPSTLAGAIADLQIMKQTLIRLERGMRWMIRQQP